MPSDPAFASAAVERAEQNNEKALLEWSRIVQEVNQSVYSNIPAKAADYHDITNGDDVTVELRTDGLLIKPDNGEQ